MSLLYALIALGCLIVVHELGHMLVARAMGMRVERFSVGFGPPLLSFKGQKTTYQLAMIPLGGFVHITGMNPHDGTPPDAPGSYANASPGARFLTIAAGPLTNYLFAMLIIGLVFLVWGRPIEGYLIHEVDTGSPAASGGVKSGDEIIRVDGKKTPQIPQVLEAIQASRGQPMRLTVLRGGREVELVLTPRKDGASYRIGVQFGSRLTFQPVSPAEAVIEGVTRPFIISAATLASLGRMFTGKVSTGQVGGPLEIIRQLKMSFEEGLVKTILFLGLLNVLLGLFNLLPVPALDGGRLIFLLFTLVTRRPVNERVEHAVHMVGFIILLGLIVLLSLRDTARIFGGP